jgi:hypothetical protein
MRERHKRAVFLFLGSLVAFALTLSAQPAGERTIQQLGGKVVIDGILDDWRGIEALPVDRTPSGARREPSADLAVTVRLAFDAENLYAAVEAVDDLFEFPDRGQAPSDGFYLGLMEPRGEDTGRRFLVFGFSRRGETEIKLLVNRDGELFPQAFSKDIQLKVAAGEENRTIIYELALPWKYIPAFRPFFQPEWAINIIYTDIDKGKEKIVQLVPDPEFESDVAALGQAEVFHFVTGPPQELEFQSVLNANHFFPEQERIFSLAVNAPEARQGWEARIVLSSAAGTASSRKPLSFDKGMSIIKFPIEIAKPAPGLYDVSLGVLDEKGALRFSDDKQFYFLDTPSYEAYVSRLAEIRKKDIFNTDVTYRESLPVVEIRLKWIKEFMDDAPPFADIAAFQQWNQDVKELLKKLEEGKPALFPGGMARLAYRSERDGALKPYSVFVPDWTDKKTPLPLFITLSLRGEDERQAVMAFASGYFNPQVRRRAGDFIILAPGVRDRSGWFAGESGEEVLECVAHLKKLYGINEKAVFLDGFSKGGYGALRLALLHPEAFRAVMIRSGRLVPPADVKAENLFDLLAEVPNLSFLFVHGDEDEIAPVQDVRQAAAKLQELKSSVRLIEVKGGGHGNSHKWEDVFSWVRDVLGNDMVVIKPPKKEKEKEKEK